MYLLAICILQVVVLVLSHGPDARTVPSGLMDVRDVVALFGWVGLMISGVSVIIVPNHLRVRVRPLRLPTAHLVFSNIGLVGFLATSIVSPGGAWSDAFLVLLSLSFLAFGLGIVGTLLPFIARPFRHPAAPLPAPATR